MTDPRITCPKCNTDIALTQSLAAPLIASLRADYDRRLAAKDRDMAGREEALVKKSEALAEAQGQLQAQVEARLQAERSKIAAVEAQKARQALALEHDQMRRQVDDLQRHCDKRGQQLEEAHKAQAALMRDKRDLEEARRKLDLTIEQRVNDALVQAKQAARSEAEERFKLEVAEKHQTIEAMKRHIEDLKRKAEQGSQQMQGEVQELALERDLRERFVYDLVEPVPKGQFGGDCLQVVMSAAGARCGSILWESKRTKNFSEGWLQKLRDDQRAAGAEVAVLVSSAMPKGIELFELIDGIWVVHPRAAVAVASVLRQSIVEMARVRAGVQGQETKSTLMYQYLTGPMFRHRVAAMVERFVEMQDDLEKERRVLQRTWSKRECQIRSVIETTAAMYGDMQGIAGRSLQEIEGLDLSLLEPHQLELA